MQDIVAGGQRFFDHFYGKPPTNQVVAGFAVIFREPTIRKLARRGASPLRF
jgi:hypothetical protein